MVLSPEYRGFMMAKNILDATERPLPSPGPRVSSRLAWADVFPETPLPPTRIAVVTIWASWSAHAPQALVDLQDAEHALRASGVDASVLTAVEPSSNPADVERIRRDNRIGLRTIPLTSQHLLLTEAVNQIPTTLMFRSGSLIDRHLGAQTADELEIWITTATGGAPAARAR